MKHPRNILEVPTYGLRLNPFDNWPSLMAYDTPNLLQTSKTLEKKMVQTDELAKLLNMLLLELLITVKKFVANMFPSSNL